MDKRNIIFHFEVSAKTGKNMNELFDLAFKYLCYKYIDNCNTDLSDDN